MRITITPPARWAGIFAKFKSKINLPLSTVEAQIPVMADGNPEDIVHLRGADEEESEEDEAFLDEEEAQSEIVVEQSGML